MADEGKFEVVLFLERTGNLTTTGFILPTEVSPEQYQAIGRGFDSIQDAAKFWIGDWILQGEALWGEEVYQYIEAINISEASRQQYARIAQRIPAERRVEGLSWSHHRAVVALEPDEQDLWLKRALDSGWSKFELEEHLREQREHTESTTVREHVRRTGIAAAAEALYVASIKKDDEGYLHPVACHEQLREALGIVEAGE
jgi:hypothetical protein